MGNNRNPMNNIDGYADPTAYQALKPIMKEDAALDSKVHKLIECMKLIVDLTGFELIGRIQIKDKKTGKEFR